MSEIKHYGTPRHSGRYPWGSGENPYQSSGYFLSYIDELRKKGLTESEIAKGLDITTTKLRAQRSIARAEQRRDQVAEVTKLKDKGYSNVAIGKKMGINESSVRSLLDPVIQARADGTSITADMLKERVDKVKYLDVGAGVENRLGITKTRLNTAIAMLEEQGYKVQYTEVEQLGVPGNFTSLKVLTPPDVDGKELWANRGDIATVANYSEDGGRSYLGLEPVKSVDSKRVQIVYAEEGGKDKDGVLEIRPGVEDLSLGNSRYAQVRVGVDDTHYMKGMAIYSDKLPDGIDILYNTNKPKGTDPSKVFKTQEPDMNSLAVKKIRESIMNKGVSDKELNAEVLKKAKEGVKQGIVPPDPDNPFGSIIRQKHYIDKDGNKQLSALNIMGSNEGAGEEGAWDEGS